MKLLAGTDHALRADHPLQFHGHQLRAFANHRLETRLVIGQALDPVVLGLVRGQHIVEPQRGADQRGAKPHGVEHFGAGLADCHGAARRLLEGQLAAAVLDHQGIVGRGRMREGGQTQGGDEGGKA
ncbi:hypothetical protein D3C87_1699220 [compost metagenome]